MIDDSFFVVQDDGQFVTLDDVTQVTVDQLISSDLDLNSNLLLHFDDTVGSTTFTDSSGNNQVVVADANDGKVAIQNDQSKFGGASCKFTDATMTNYLNLGDYPYLHFGLGDFTIDAWIRYSGGVPPSGYFYVFTNFDLYFLADVEFGPDLLMRVNNPEDGEIITGTTALQPDTWYHVALTRASGLSRMFVNGVQEGVTATDGHEYTVLVEANIGNNIGGAGAGWMDEFRIIKGSAAWTSNFTPPTAPYIGFVQQPPLVGEPGFGRPPEQIPLFVRGEGFGILPELEGEAHGFVIPVAAGLGTLSNFIGEAAGGGAVGDSTAQLIVHAISIGAHGENGTATIVVRVIATSSGAVGSYGSGSGTLTIKGAAIGRHDDDEIAAAILLAA